jgi:hypothetical protein
MKTYRVEPIVVFFVTTFTVRTQVLAEAGRRDDGYSCMENVKFL